jgi:hypothetical protein
MVNLVMRQHTFICFTCCLVWRGMSTVFLSGKLGSNKLPDDDQLMIETCWGDFKCFNV